MWNIREYRRGGMAFFADRLSWYGRLEPSLYLQKDGAFLRVFEFNGHDPLGIDHASFDLVYEALNKEVRRYGKGWAFWIEASRRRIPTWERVPIDNPGADLFDIERTAPIISGERFHTSNRIGFMWLPPSDTEVATEGMIENRDDEDAQIDYREHVDRFLRDTMGMAMSLRPHLPGIKPFSARGGDTYLKACVSDVDQEVCLGHPYDIADQLCDADYTGTHKPMLGDVHFRTVGLRGYPEFPEKTQPGMLAGLDALPIEYRYVTRWIALGEQEAKKRIDERYRNYFTGRAGIWAIIMKAFTQNKDLAERPDAVHDSDDAHAALDDFYRYQIGYGTVTATLCTWHRDRAFADEAVKEVLNIFRSQCFTAKEEGVLAQEAFLGSMPGHAYANPARLLLPSRSFAHMSPLTSVWTGAKPEHTIMVGKTPGCDVFRVGMHAGGTEGGTKHGLVLGQSGGGKSVFVGSFAIAALREKLSRVIVLEKGKSARIATLCCGGEYIDIGNGSMAFQPLADVDTDEGFRAAHDWVVALLKYRAVEVGIDTDRNVTEVLKLIASLRPRERTLTTFHSMMPPGPSKEAIKPFLIGGRYEGLLDANSPPDLGSRMLGIEMSALFEDDMRGALVPTMAHIFRLIKKGIKAGPGYLIVDEGWRFILDSAFAPQLTEFSKEMRKYQWGFILATQEPADLSTSSMKSTILTNHKTRICTADPRAMEDEQSKQWAALGYDAQRRDILRNATLARDYIIDQDGNFGVFSLDLGALGLAMVASNSKEDHEEADRILHMHGRQNFLPHWLKFKGLGHMAPAIAHQAFLNAAE